MFQGLLVGHSILFECSRFVGGTLKNVIKFYLNCQGLLVGHYKMFKVCWWDTRKGGAPEAVISLQCSHIEPVYKVAILQYCNIENN